MRKAISICLILAYINTFLACSTKTVKQLDISHISSNDKDIAVVLFDLTKYYFESETYKFKTDSLEGIALTEDSQILSLKTIGVSEIFQFEEVKKELDGGKVAIFTVVTLVTVLVGGAIAMVGKGFNGI